MRDEAIKGAFHMAAVIIVAPLLAYNAKEFMQHQHPRNGMNALVYAFVLGFEVWNTFGHWYADERSEYADQRNGR